MAQTPIDPVGYLVGTRNMDTVYLDIFGIFWHHVLHNDRFSYDPLYQISLYRSGFYGAIMRKQEM